MNTTRAFRVFVSSTFADFAEEREALGRIVAPELRRFCLSRGVDFQLVDLRWGINSLSARSQRTLDICLSEIDRTLSLAAKPSFLVLLGDRYGWRPLPVHIDAVVFEQLTSQLAIVDEEAAALLRRRYRLDENAVPPRYELTNSAEQQQQNKTAAETEIRDALKRGIECSGLAGHPHVQGFFWSATHHEIERGALSGVSADHVVTCFRTVKETSRNTFREDAPEAQLALADLRNRLRHATGSHLYEFMAELHDGKVDDAYLKDFVAQVTQAFETLVLEQLDSAPPISERVEGFDHEARSRILTSGFVARQRERAELRDLVDKFAGQRPVLLTGPSGSGKTTLIAAAASDLRSDRPGMIVVERFVGTTPGSARAFSLLIGIAHQLRRELNVADPLVPAATIGEAVQQLQQVLRHASGERPVALFIDALDQLDDNEPVDWLEQLVLPHVTIVWSVLTGSRLLDREDQELPVAELKLLPLPANESVAILDERMRDAGRTLTTAQRARIMPAIERADYPLYSQIAFQVVRNWRSWDEGFELPPSLERLIAAFFEQLVERDHGRVLVDRALALLAASRHGLAEMELLELLSSDAEVMDEFARLEPNSPRTAQLPQIVLSRLVAAIESFLAIRGIQGSRLYSFFHRVVADFAAQKYLATNSAAHSALARYFDDQPTAIAESDGSASRLNARKLSELPAAMINCGNWERVSALLNDFAFLMAKCEARLAEELVVDVERASRSPAGETLKEVSMFMARHGVHLRGDSDIWPAHRVLLQMAIDQLPEAPLQKRAQAYLESGAYDVLWLRPAWLEIPDGIVCRIEAGTPIVNVECEDDGYLLLTLRGNRRRRWSLVTGLALGDELEQTAIEITQSTDEPSQPIDLEDGWRVSIDNFRVVMWVSEIQRLTIERVPEHEETDSDKKEESGDDQPVPMLASDNRRVRFALGSGVHRLRAVTPRRWAIWDERGNLTIWDLDQALQAAASRERVPKMAAVHVGAIHRVTNLGAVSHGLHDEYDPHLSFWDCTTGMLFNTVTLPAAEGRATNEIHAHNRWITGSTSVNGIAMAWGKGATIGMWHPKAHVTVAMCGIFGEFEILSAKPFWYSPKTMIGVVAGSRERRADEHLVVAMLSSHGVNVLFDATLMQGTAVYQSPWTRFPEYARRYEMFGFDLLADGRLARRYCNEFPMVYDLGEAFAAPKIYTPIILHGEWNPSSGAQDASQQVRRTMVLTGGQFITLRGDEIAAYKDDGTLIRTWAGRDLLELPDKRLLIFSVARETNGCGAIYDLESSTAPLILTASTSPILGASNLRHDEILTWHDDGQFRTWTTATGDLRDSCPQSDAWHRRPDWVEAWMAAVGSSGQCLGWGVWQSPSLMGLTNTSPTSAPEFVAWYSGVKCEAQWIEPDGTVVVVCDGTQPRVLHLYRGNARVDLVAARSSAPVRQPFVMDPQVIRMLAEECLATADLVRHLARQPQDVDCQLESLNDVVRLLHQSDANSLDDLYLRTYVERASVKVRQDDYKGAIEELRSRSFSDGPPDALMRRRCMLASLLLIERYASDGASVADQIAEIFNEQPIDDLLAAFDRQIDVCGVEREWEAQLYSVGLVLAILFVRDRAGGSIPPGDIERWRSLPNINVAREQFELSLVKHLNSLTKSLHSQIDLAWLDAHVFIDRVEAPHSRIDVPTPHPAADPERAARLNIAYQKELAAWRALPFFKRLRTKKPQPPTGI